MTIYFAKWSYNHIGSSGKIVLSGGMDEGNLNDFPFGGQMVGTLNVFEGGGHDLNEPPGSAPVYIPLYACIMALSYM